MAFKDPGDVPFSIRFGLFFDGSFAFVALIWASLKIESRVNFAEVGSFFVLGVVEMAGAFEEEAEQTITIQEYLKDVEDQELVSLSLSPARAKSSAVVLRSWSHLILRAGFRLFSFSCFKLPP